MNSIQQQTIDSIPAIYRMDYDEYLHWWITNQVAAHAVGIDAGEPKSPCIVCSEKVGWDGEGYCLSCSPLRIDP